MIIPLEFHQIDIYWVYTKVLTSNIYMALPLYMSFNTILFGQCMLYILYKITLLKGQVG